MFSSPDAKRKKLKELNPKHVQITFHSHCSEPGIANEITFHSHCSEPGIANEKNTGNF